MIVIPKKSPGGSPYHPTFPMSSFCLVLINLQKTAKACPPSGSNTPASDGNGENVAFVKNEILLNFDFIEDRICVDLGIHFFPISEMFQ